MMLHGSARTCPKSRRLLVERIERGGWSVTLAAEAAGVGALGWEFVHVAVDGATRLA